MKLQLIIMLVLLTVSLVAAAQDYPRPKIRTILDKPYLDKGTRSIIPSDPKAWLAENRKPISTVFSQKKGKLESLTKTRLEQRPKPAQPLASVIARSSYKPKAPTFTGAVIGAPTVFKLNTGKERRTPGSRFL